jgi:hypothetical protein
VIRINGEARSSIIIDPPNGRLPPRTEAGRKGLAELAARRAKFGEFDHPEMRPLAERCLVSFGSNAGPPMLPNYYYNNNYTIVQSADDILILTEMNHDVRTIRMGATHKPNNVRPWFGDSIGRWEGDTLVVETTTPAAIADLGAIRSAALRSDRAATRATPAASRRKCRSTPRSRDRARTTTTAAIPGSPK